MTVVISTFAEALADARSDARRTGTISLLLGNGFSRAFSGDFAYQRLRDVAELDDRLTVGQGALFEHAGSDDFETVIYHLEQSARLIELYDPADTGLAMAMGNDARVVRDGLVETLTRIHPDSARTVDDAKYVAVRQFLSSFANIFTVNYDLLLYWLFRVSRGVAAWF